ncbi:FtsQ-type POTRA domain-containing protein [Nocardioides marinquilinus]|uniref:Cell division protein FtsQ n=1 Tax=Nocardioides marinquilinus TaxID=1210400 RepID=A0ABP9PS02_9ACTN
MASLRRPGWLRRRGAGADDERSRRRFARRQWARRWVTLRWAIVALVLVLLVGGAVYTVYFSTALDVEGAEVVGARTVSTEQVLDVADVPTGGPLATVDLDAIKRRVGSLAVVRAVEVTRQWPHEVRIEIQEREPVAVVDRGTEFRAVDAEGVVFNSYRRAPRDLPRIETDDPASTEELQEAASVVASLPTEVVGLVDHLELRGVDQIDLSLRDGRLVRWGSAEGSASKAEVIVVLLREKGRVYDVSVPGAPTVSG